MTITVRALAGSNNFEVEAKTLAGVRELYVIGTWPTCIAALSAYVETLR